MALDKETERLKFTLEEYSKIKQENLQSIQTMHGSLQFGLSAISLLFVAVGQLWGNVLIEAALLMVAIPLVCVLVERVWSGELIRLARASHFLSLLEAAINSRLSTTPQQPQAAASDAMSLDEALRWEAWVRGRNRWGKSVLMRRAYKSTLIGLLSLAAGASVTGALYLTTGETPLNFWVAASVAATSCCGTLWFLWGEQKNTWAEIMSYAN
ncbi:hypothetical protein [Streptomyces sp. NPDC048357]|uniref:hypothetical protein n=1 Tax=Streptomyces sp. NPDC048357 TaxID=3154719 RepID=UPI00343C74A8